MIRKRIYPKQYKDILEPEYARIHRWLKNNFGIAIKCDNNLCEGKSINFQWALVKGKKYEKNRENFIQLCKSCHSKYDITEETFAKKSKAFLGVKRNLSPETIASIRSKLLGNRHGQKHDGKQKLCPHCKEIKLLSEFGTCRSKWSRGFHYRGWCRVCEKERLKQYY